MIGLDYEDTLEYAYDYNIDKETYLTFFNRHQNLTKIIDLLKQEEYLNW